MPKDSIVSIEGIPNVKVKKIDKTWLRDSANLFGVSEHAFLIRLVDLGIVAQDYYWSKMRQQFLKEESQYQPFGRSTYYGKRYVGTHGQFYTSLVLDAMGRGILDAHNAANFLGIKNLQHLADIRAEARV